MSSRMIQDSIYEETCDRCSTKSQERNKQDWCKLFDGGHWQPEVIQEFLKSMPPSEGFPSPVSLCPTCIESLIEWVQDDSR